MKKTHLLLAVCGALLAFSAAAESTFLIARGKSANATICVPKDASAPTRYAAEELAKYLGEMSGAKFKVVAGAGGSAKRIVVGEPYAGAKPEEICLKVSKDGKTLAVTGEGPRGPIYAVYALLERLGCGFWTPARETVPELKEIAVPANLNVVEAPAFEVRQPYGASVWENPRWAVRLRINGGAYAGNLSEQLGGNRQYDLSQSKLGLEGNGKLFAAHPEWYALRGGKRSAQHLCNANPGVRAELVRRVKEKLQKHPDLNQIALGLNDGGEFCQCPACSKLRQQEGSQIGPELDLCNYVARQFAKSNPKTRFLVFAYEASLRPPKKMKCEPNVDVCVAYIQRNYARDPGAGTRSHNEIVGAWSKLTGDNVYIWGYCAQFKDYMIAWPTVDTLGPEMRTYRDLRVKGIYMQMADDTHSDFLALRCWLAAKLMWNPDQDEMKLMEQWCAGACGKGGKYVFEWLKVCKRVREGVKSLGVYSGDSRETFKSAADILKGDELLAKAEAAAKDDPTALAEIHRIRGNVTHMMLVRYYYDVAATAKKANYAIPPREALLKTLLADKIASWCEGVGWHQGFLPRIRHGEVQPEKSGDGPRMRGAWTMRNPMSTGTKEDPFVTYDDAAKYYYRVMTVGNEFRIRRARKLTQLFDEKCEEKVLWTPKRSDAVSSNLRGPELVRGADGKWRVYACGGEVSIALDDEKEDDAVVSRLFLLEGGKDPFAGAFRFAGALLPKENASDPTVFKMPNGKWYLFYARETGKPGIIARELGAPAKPGAKEGFVRGAKKGDELMLSPALAQMGKDVYLFYGVGGRASASSKVCALKYLGGDPLKPKSWEACAKPLLVSGNAFHNEVTQLVGPRSPSTFRSSDGTEAWIAFRGWTSRTPANEAKDSIMCLQRLDNGCDRDALMLDTGAELRILLLQPSGDFDPVAVFNARKGK